MWHNVPSLEEMIPQFATKAEAKRVRKMLLEVNRIHQEKIDAIVAEQASVPLDFTRWDRSEVEQHDFIKHSFCFAGGSAIRRRLRREADRRRKLEQRQKQLGQSMIAPAVFAVRHNPEIVYNSSHA